MNTRRSFLQRAVAVVTTIGLTSTAFADSTNLQAWPMTGRVPRGQSIRFLVRLSLDGRAAPAGFNIAIQERIGGPNAKPRTIALCPTDGAGWVRFDYVVPMDPKKDNIYLSAYFGGRSTGVGIPWIASQSVAQRVPIGTK